MKKKKIIALVSAVSMLGSAFTALPVAVSAQESVDTVYEQDFELLGAQTLLEHNLDTEESVNSVKSGYTAMVNSGGSPILTWTDAGGGSMKMEDVEDRYTSAGLRYNITDLVKGKSGRLTITAEVRGGFGEVIENGGRIGFINETQAAEADSAKSASGFMYNFPAVTVGTENSGDFTTISYTVDSIPEHSTDLYFFIGITKPTMYVKSVKLTLEDESSSDSRITPYTRYYGMSSSVISDERAGMDGKYLALKNSNNDLFDAGQGAVIDLSELGIDNGDKLDVSFDIATNAEKLGKLQTFVVSAASVEDLNSGFLQSEGATANGGANGWVSRAGCGYEGISDASSSKVSYIVDSVTIDENEKPYLCIMDANPTIYLDNIEVSVISEKTETHREGFEFSERVTLDELRNMSFTITANDNGTEKTGTLAIDTVTSGEGEAIVGIIIENIPDGVNITSVKFE